jgi:S-adenosylmethionine decarboxylase
MESWGQHLALDFAGCNIKKIKDKKHVEKFAKELVKKIKMVAYGEPQVINFGSGDKAGFTLIQLIETSNIAAHFCNDTGDVYLDVFSCKKFNTSKVIKTFNKYFGSKDYKLRVFPRQAPKI